VKTSKFVSALCVLTLLAVGPSAQEQSANDPAQTQRMVGLADLSSRLAIAVAADDYPVTPGDVYTLTYVTSGLPVVYDVVVNSDYTVDLRLFGHMQCRGKAFHELRAEAEAAIARAYPGSAPTLAIRSVGIFPVLVKGAVKQPGRVIAWGLSRLTDVVRDGLEHHGSDRDVEVVSRDGHSSRYDVYRAYRLGDNTQDPLLRAGDTIVVSRSKRTVTVSGAVNRPGLYHLLDSDRTVDVMQVFCDGFAPSADRDRVRVTRQPEDATRILYMSGGALMDLALADGDEIEVQSRADLLPVVTFEGAINPVANSTQSPATTTGGATGDPYGTVRVPIVPGDRLSHVLSGVKDRIAANADVSRAAIVRRDQSLPVDLYRVMNEYSLKDDPILEPYDRIVIPSTRYTITVSGAVVSPGSYYYTPGKSPRYYVALAGGPIPEQNSRGVMRAYDAAGKKQSLDAEVVPGARIVVSSNDFAYNFNRYFPVVTTTLTLVTATLTIMQLVR
jgi:polysaccharide biosynthesis/export protein